jgi:hypothetical protein
MAIVRNPSLRAKAAVPIARPAVAVAAPVAPAMPAAGPMVGAAPGMARPAGVVARSPVNPAILAKALMARRAV